MWLLRTYYSNTTKPFQPNSDGVSLPVTVIINNLVAQDLILYF